MSRGRDQGALPARVLPHNHDAEASVLGGIFFRNEILVSLGHLTIEDFHNPKHQAVFNAIRNLEGASGVIDPITVGDELGRQGRLDSIGGLAFLGEIALAVPSVENVLHYADIIIRHAMVRRTAHIASDILERCFTAGIDDNDADDIVAWGITKLSSIESRHEDPGMSKGELMRIELDEIERDLEAMENGVVITGGMPSGITKLDERIGGIPIGVPTLVMGGTGHGKSTLLDAMATAVGKADDFAFIYAFEDPKKFWAQRGIAQESGIATEQIAARRNLTGPGVAKRLAHAHTRSAYRTEIVIPSSNWTMDDVIADARSRRNRMQVRLGGRKRRLMVLIDYIQAMEHVRGRGVDKLTEAMATSMNRAQWLAQGCGSTNPEDQCAVVISSQVKPAVEAERRAPEKSDWVDSVATINVAKLILGINRPSKYDQDADPLIGWVEVLKRSQGSDLVRAKVTLDLATHSIRDFDDPEPVFRF